MNRQAPVLQLENIHKRYAGLEVLKGIDLAANAGDAISIIGSSGSGKSTLLRCINLLERPDEGRIVLDGEELKLARQRDGAFNAADTRQLDRFRTQLGFVFQSFNLWPHMTILQNVAEAPTQVRKQAKAEAIEQAEALLQKVGLYDKRDAYPVSLSGGQQQRAAIARALVQKAKIILADEPVASLDPVSARKVMEILSDLNSADGLTVIVTLHQVDYALRYCRRVVALKAGQIVYDGPPGGLTRKRLIDIYGPEFEDVFWEGAPS